VNRHLAHLAAVAWANGGSLYGANLCGADLIGADLSESNFRSSNLGDANLSGADLCGTDLRWSSLRGANLRGARVRHARLNWAQLDSVDITGADFHGTTFSSLTLWGAKKDGDRLSERITEAMRRDGFAFRLFRLKDGSHKIMAGCRWFTIPEYRAHVAAEYPGTDRARETLDILDFFERRAGA